MADINEQILYKLGELDSKLDSVKDAIESHEPRIQKLEQSVAAQGARSAMTAGILGVAAGIIGDFFIKLWPSSH